MTKKKAKYEIRRNEDGSLDEIVAYDSFVHLEQMDTGHWWLGITLPDGKIIHTHLTSRGKITANTEYNV